jgi:CheY-like chemotaxis protein
VVRVALESEGFEVLDATNGAEVVSAARSSAVDAIVLDAHMPGASLTETLHELLSSPQTSAVPVIVLSGGPVELGADGASVVECLRKPITLDALCEAVQPVAARFASARSEPAW